MTVHQRNVESGDSCYPAESSCSKNNWSEMDNGSLSWDRNSRGTSSSWPGDMEESATRKVLQLWDVIERNIFDEIDENESSSLLVSEECNQWRTQLTHIRIVGKSLVPRDSNNESSTRVKSRGENRSGEEISTQNSGDTSYKIENCNSKYSGFEEDQNQVFDRIFEFVCSELSRETKKKETHSIGKDLDDFLRITPAPTCSARRTLRDRKKRVSRGSRKNSANENRSKPSDNDFNCDSSVDKNNRTISAGIRNSSNRSKLMDNNENLKDYEVDLPQVARNKLGTVFNEKIVVSPVPFVVTQRESFTTLRATPISFCAQSFEISTPQGLGRYMHSASKNNSAQRISAYRLSQSHSAWQTPVCPAVWPKNIRLAPIDPARLPSGKNRSSSDSPALRVQRNRNSLSPISRPSKVIQSGTLRDTNFEGLEIKGRQIIVCSAKHNHLTSDSPRSSKSSRGKFRAQKRHEQ